MLVNLMSLENLKSIILFGKKTLQVLSTMVYVDKTDDSKTSRVPSLDNWMVTVRGLQLLCKNLLGGPARYLLLRNFNQDPVEIFFGSIRSVGVRNVKSIVLWLCRGIQNFALE